MGVLSETYNITFSVKRLTTGVGLNSRIKLPIEISNNNWGFIRPITDRNKSYNNQDFGKEYKLHAESNVDVQVTDIVSINTIDYSVSAVTLMEDPLSIDSFLKIILVKA